MTVLQKIADCVDYYRNHKDSMVLEELQRTRDELSLAMYYISDQYSEVKVAAAQQEYLRKKCQAEKSIELRDAPGKMTREEILNRVTIDCEEAQNEEFEAIKSYEKIRQVISACTHILNSISSNINIKTR
jgi:hypothetical protein